jgi:hypothetical protein
MFMRKCEPPVVREGGGKVSGLVWKIVHTMENKEMGTLTAVECLADFDTY